jgi:hypothetical protein
MTDKTVTEITFIFPLLAKTNDASFTCTEEAQKMLKDLLEDINVPQLTRIMP